MEHWERRLIHGEPFNVGWQHAKAALNARKHRVAFTEALAVLDDPHARATPQSAAGEARELLIGRGDAGRLLTVAVSITAPGDDGTTEDVGFLRIISARRATPTEEALYRS